LFYYLNRTGYNGLCRFNQRGGFNVPFGQYATIAYRRDFTSHQAALADWDFSSVDVSEVACQPGDFVYADPPYDVEFTQYAREGFTWTDQERTARLLAGHAGPVILVNQATPRIEALYRELGFDITFLTAPRRINCTGDRRPAREIMATKNV
jgi:DNA adenine methylase